MPAAKGPVREGQLTLRFNQFPKMTTLPEHRGQTFGSGRVRSFHRENCGIQLGMPAAPRFQGLRRRLTCGPRTDGRASNCRGEIQDADGVHAEKETGFSGKLSSAVTAYKPIPTDFSLLK